MTQTSPLAELFSTLLESVQAGHFVKLTLSKPTPAADPLKSVDIRPAIIKRELKLSFTYHNKTNDIVKNHAAEEAVAVIGELLSAQFLSARLHSTNGDLHANCKNGQWHISRHPAAHKAAPELAHDRAKHRLISTHNKHYLHALGLTDTQGNINKNSHDKFSQINKYIEILDGLLKRLPHSEPLRIVDMGAGKGYLTFALYDHLAHTLKRRAEVIGVEYRDDLVKKCNRIAKDSRFDGLRFEQGTIDAFDCSGANVVIALHACDTATDDAIFKAIRAEAALIVVAPCCHKQIRNEMRASKTAGNLDFLTRYGTYQERLAEMVTDGMRSQLLELSGYQTNLFEFISDAHTPKNVMIVANKLPAPLPTTTQNALSKTYAETKAQFGISKHKLEELLGR